MTEAEWARCSSEEASQQVVVMLTFLGETLSRRKQTLLACGSFYAHAKKDNLEYPWEFQAREVAERFVDGAATREELDGVYADIERDLAADPNVTDFFHNTLGDRGWTAQSKKKGSGFFSWHPHAMLLR